MLYEIAKKGAKFTITTGEKPLLTPAGAEYSLPTKDLAEEMAKEWNRQSEKSEGGKKTKIILSDAMPLSQLAATAIDLISKKREAAIDGLVGYALAELLCHRAEKDEALSKKQDETWQPLLDWCAAKYGALLNVGAGVMPVEQSSEATNALHSAVAEKDDFALAGLSLAVGATGSLVLALALSEGQRAAKEIFEAAELDSNHQSIKWGKDPVTQSRHAAILYDIELCEKWFGLLGK